MAVGKVFQPQGKCKICKSPHVFEIHAMLDRGTAVRDIIAHALKNWAESYNKMNFSNHKNHYYDPSNPPKKLLPKLSKTLFNTSPSNQAELKILAGSKTHSISGENLSSFEIQKLALLNIIRNGSQPMLKLQAMVQLERLEDRKEAKNAELQDHLEGVLGEDVLYMLQYAFGGMLSDCFVAEKKLEELGLSQDDLDDLFNYTTTDRANKIFWEQVVPDLTKKALEAKFILDDTLTDEEKVEAKYREFIKDYPFGLTKEDFT